MKQQEANVSNAMLACLKLRLELIEHYEVGRKFQYYADEIARLQRRIGILTRSTAG